MVHKCISGLPVSSFTWKELESHHSVLTSEKLNRLKNQQFFFFFFPNHKRGEGRVQTAAPRTEKTDRQMQASWSKEP